MPSPKGRATVSKYNGAPRIAALVLAVAYYRMSSDKQDKSIDEQKTKLNQLAAANGYKIVREYTRTKVSAGI